MRKAILLTFLFFFLISTGVAGYGFLKYKHMTDQWYQPLQPEVQNKEGKDQVKEETRQQNLPLVPQEKMVKPEEKPQMSPFTVMILGVDFREGERKARSDTMMLAAVNPSLQKVTLLSIPRDTLVRIPGYGQDKFNHSMFYGGPTLVKQTIEEFFDMKVDRYVTLDFEGFIKLVDELGGVEVDVKRRMKYNDPMDGTAIDLRPGVQHLDGKQALDYARFRKSDIGSDASDFDRMARQQEVVKQLSEKASRVSTVFRVFSLMNILGEHIKTDFSEEEVRKLAILFKNFSSSKIQIIELKGTSQRLPKHGYNLWFHVVSDEEKKRIYNLIQETLQ